MHERERDKKDSTPQVVCCYRLKLEESGKLLLQFVEGQAVSANSIRYLEWVSAVLGKAGEGMLVMIWANASWHGSKMVL